MKLIKKADQVELIVMPKKTVEMQKPMFDKSAEINHLVYQGKIKQSAQ
jgi:hypothetical protein